MQCAHNYSFYDGIFIEMYRSNKCLNGLLMIALENFQEIWKQGNCLQANQGIYVVEKLKLSVKTNIFTVRLGSGQSHIMVHSPKIPWKTFLEIIVTHEINHTCFISELSLPCQTKCSAHHLRFSTTWRFFKMKSMYFSESHEVYRVMHVRSCPPLC